MEPDFRSEPALLLFSSLDWFFFCRPAVFHGVQMVQTSTYKYKHSKGLLVWELLDTTYRGILAGGPGGPNDSGRQVLGEEGRRCAFLQHAV